MAIFFCTRETFISVKCFHKLLLVVVFDVCLSSFINIKCENELFVTVNNVIEFLSCFLLLFS